MNRIFVIGTASLDVLHLNAQQPPIVECTIGGAGLYTALAATKAGAQATLFAPRPIQLPAVFEAAASHIQWLGPTCDETNLPRLEIAHYGGGKAELLGASWGAETRMTPADLPDDLSGYAYVHIAALSSAQRQLAFLQACRQRGATCISVGTYAHLIINEADTVRKLLAAANLFFMNENEARGLFGSLDAVQISENTILFITLGEHGALAFHQNQRIAIPALPAHELDPTGAGDTFCGATLASLAHGETIEQAARTGSAWAVRIIAKPGPAAMI